MYLRLNTTGESEKILRPLVGGNDPICPRPVPNLLSPTLPDSGPSNSFVVPFLGAISDTAAMGTEPSLGSSIIMSVEFFRGFIRVTLRPPPTLLYFTLIPSAVPSCGDRYGLHRR